MNDRLGFIGLGNMGRPIARRLLDAGHHLVVYDVSPAACNPLASLGAEVALSPAEVGGEAETVFLSLPAPEVVVDVATGGRGVAKGSQVHTIIDLSTTGSTTSKAIAASVGQFAIELIDAPVSGGVAGAESGSLTVMVGASVDGFHRTEPLLRVLGRVFHVGKEPGDGQSMKVANNYLSATALAATSEAVVFGIKAGLDPHVMIDVLNAGSGRSSATEDKFPRSILNRRFDFGFTTGLVHKDLRLFTEQAELLGVPLLLGSVVRHVWFSALTVLGAGADFTEIIKVIECAAGVQVPVSRDASGVDG